MALDFVATYKVLVLGDSNVGKTCIVHRYCDEKYYDTYISTIGKSQSESGDSSSLNSRSIQSIRVGFCGIRVLLKKA